MTGRAERTYIVDDDAGMRRSLRFVLVSAGYDARPFLSGEDLLDELPHLQPGIVLLDVRMPGMDGLEVLARLHEDAKRFPVIVMTGHGDVPTAVKAMKLGAADFLEKPFVDDALLQALAHVRQRLAADEAYERRRAKAERTVAELTVREREVLQGIAAGYANRQIAETLGLSVRTVESYRADMTEKVGTTAVADLVRLALLVNLPPLEGEESPPAQQER